jgi:hypothetical protein
MGISGFQKTRDLFITNVGSCRLGSSGSGKMRSNSVLLRVDESKGRYPVSAQQRPTPYLGNEEARGALVKSILAFLYVR